jgi:23S rRNA pseudouridine1911/1915/1917 synthase
MDTIDTKLVIVDEDGAGTRLDKFLSDRLPDFSRSRIQALLAQGHLTLQGVAITDAAMKVKSGQKFHLVIPIPAPSHMLAQAMDLDIIYEDEDVIVINKQAGLTVHPAPGNRDMTLVNALLAHCGESLSGIGGVERPGIVHRIDKDTTGLLVVAKNDAAHNHLSAQLATRTLKRTYRAICWGTPIPAQGTITGNIGRSISNRQKMAVVKKGGKSASTHYQVIQNLQPSVVSMIECQLETGRTHQIRVHFLHIGHPLVGDATYGASTESRLKSSAAKNLYPDAKAALLAFNRQALHAYKMGFIHPRSGKEMHFEAPLPDDMKKLIAALQ